MFEQVGARTHCVKARPEQACQREVAHHLRATDGHGYPHPPGIVPRPVNRHPRGSSPPPPAEPFDTRFSLALWSHTGATAPCLRLPERAPSRRPTGAGGAASGPAAPSARRGRGGGVEANYAAMWLGRSRASADGVTLRIRRRSFAPRRPFHRPPPRRLRLLRLVFLLLARLLLPSASNLLLYLVVLASP